MRIPCFAKLLAHLLAPISLAAGLIDVGKPYLVPEIPAAKDFAQVVYIDPDAPSGGSGTIESPYTSLSGLVSNTAYLIKAGKILTQTVTNPPGNIYFGRYGEGPNPILRSADQVVAVGAVTHVTFDGIDIEKYGSGGYDTIFSLNTSASHVTFANLRIVGLEGTGGAYPHTGCKSKCSFLTFYNCEIGNVRSDALYPNSVSDLTVVSCYFHHINLSQGPGDALQIGADSHRLYFANNYVDRGDTTGKFGLAAITDGGTDIVCEWNTFVSPLAGNGGASIYWVVTDRNICSKNLIISTTSISGIASFNVCANLPEPYGVRDNHFYGPGNPFYGFTPTATDNLRFNNQAAYEDYLEQNQLEPYGSDLFRNPDLSPPSAPSSLVAIPGSGYVDLSWDAASDDVGVLDYRVVINGGTPVSAGAVLQARVRDLELETTYQFRVIAVDAAGNESVPSEPVEATTLGAVSTIQGWTYDDIGTIEISGSYDLTDGVYTLNASGSDIYGTADSFGFLHTVLHGDGSITARITSIQNTNSWAKCGVMLRESLQPGAAHASMIANPGGLLSFQRRTVSGGTAPTGINVQTDGLPGWVRIVREGNKLDAYGSTDGLSWQLVGSVTISLPPDVYLGLALTSHSSSKLNTSTLDHVELTGDHDLIIPEPSSPILTIIRDSAGQPLLQWAPGEVTLEETTSPEGPWTEITPQPTSPFAIPEPLPDGRRFYRLKSPE